MSDLIDRQVAIDKLQKEINKGTPPFDDVMGAIRCGVRLARNIIEDLPSADPHWIPCSERLPEEERYVLVTASNGAVTEAKYWQKERIWVKGLSIVSVTAWMPLPEPYGGDNK